MKKKFKLLIIVVFSFGLFFWWNIKTVNAASANISGKTSVQKGESVTITASVNAGAWNLTLSGGGQSVKLVGQTNTTSNASDSKSITFVANANTTFTLTGDITDYNEEEPKPVKKSTTIKVSEKSSTTPTPTTTSTTPNNNEPTTTNTNQNANNNKKSNNANLSNLGIRPNDFSGFKAGTTTYNVTVPENVETIEVYAKAQDSKSKISGTGKKQLQKGKNTASVTVTAEDGTKKTYTINITRKEQKEEEEEEKDKEDEKEEEQKEEESTNEEIIEKDGLAKLEIENVSLSPDFQSNIYEYAVRYIGEDTKLNIDAVATNEEYTVEVTGNEELQEGENIITILVSDARANNIATYQITVNKSLVDEEAIKQEQEQKEKDEAQKKIMIYGSIAVGVIILIIIFIIWRRRNKKLEEEYGVPFYNNQLEDFDENMKYKGNYRDNDNERNENKKIMKEKYLDIYNRRDIEFDQSEDEKHRKNKNRGKRFR